MGIIIAILIFSFIIFFHELGHFVLAKLNGIEVQEFAIGMGRPFFAKEYHGTLSAVRILPIGGYCAMGEDDEQRIHLPISIINQCGQGFPSLLQVLSLTLSWPLSVR